MRLKYCLMIDHNPYELLMSSQQRSLKMNPLMLRESQLWVQMFPNMRCESYT